MKRSSLQWKLTLWFSAALVLMTVLTFIVVFFVILYAPLAFPGLILA